MAGVAGRSGGRSKTVAQHHRDGTFDTSRHSGYTNPEPPQGAPKLPRGLSTAAKRAWRAMVQRLEQSQCLTQVEDAIIEQWAKAYVEVEEVAAAQEETQRLIAALMARIEEAEDGLSPAILVACIKEVCGLKRLEQQYVGKVQSGRSLLLKLLIEFGMTPSARGRVKLPPEAKKAQSPMGRLKAQAEGLRVVKGAG